MKYFSIFKTKSVRFYKLFISYVILVLSFLLVLSAFSYGIYFTTLQEEIVASSLSSLSQVRDIMDTRLVDMQVTANHISSKSNLMSTALTDKGFYTWQAVKDLDSLKSTLSYVYDIVVYYPDTSPGTIYAASGVYDADEYFSRAYKYSSISKKDFLDILKNLKKPYMIPAETVQSYNSEDKLLATFIQPIPVDTSMPKGYAIFLINGNESQRMLGNLLINRTGYVYVLDENNNVILSSQNSSGVSNDAILGSLDQETKLPVQKFEVNKQDMLAIKVGSLYNKWSYVKIVPYEQMMRKVFGIQKVFNLTAIIALVIGLLLSFVFALYGYKPLQKLVEAVSGQAKIPNKNIDEISFILNKINETEKEKKDLTAALKSKSGIIKEQLLTSVINGKLRNINNVDEIMAISAIKFNEQYIMVMYFLIDDYEKFRKINSGSIQELYKISIKNVIEELAQDIGKGYAVDAPDGYGILMILNLSQINIESINVLAEKVQKFFKEYFGFTLTVGVGKPYTSIYDAHLSHNEAVNASSYRLIQGPGSVIFSDKLYENASSSEIFTQQELSEQLIMYLKQARIEEIENLITRHVEGLKEKLPSLMVVKYFQYTIIMSLMKVVEEFGLQDLKKEFDNSLVISNKSTLDEFKNNVIQHSEKILKVIISRKESKNFDLRDRLLEYINENYSSRNLSLNSIAEIFNSSSSYITRFFKDQMGCSLMKYVDSLRMEKARQLLKSTNLNLKSIAEQIGYVDEENFARKFKIIEAMTPIQYRKASASGNSSSSAFKDSE